MVDLLGRLRSSELWLPRELGHEAAAEIERLESDKERLRAVLQGLIEGPCAPRYRAEAEQLRTENERLRDEIICDYPNCDCHLPCLATGKTVGELCNRKHPEMRRVDHG
jgi:hypothetical protein